MQHSYSVKDFETQFMVEGITKLLWLSRVHKVGSALMFEVRYTKLKQPQGVVGPISAMGKAVVRSKCEGLK